MVTGTARIEIRLFGVHSLKQKRSQIKRLLNRMRTRFPVSAAEVAQQDRHQCGVVGAAVCCSDEKTARSILSSLENDLETYGEVEIAWFDVDFITYGDEFH